ncbi:hypothetical protein MD588_07090 [Photobacterium sp. SDRW27]|uniref:hypothetical protein n=1 Tax=Photobacterium obscurum TaxID=2829490 RepID=UPI0022442F8A|nr:hypothetical protein [Photobacterium obscurum]MCW8328570.1 hypothetical protein [Photobacterium obscurum]
MRKTNLMLIAALVASPFALAEGYGYDYDYGYGSDIDDVTIDGSGNLYYTADAEFNKNKTVYISNVGNSDNDILKLDNVGNTYKKYVEDNSVHDWSVDFELDKEINNYLAESKLHGYVMDNTVTYGGACCKGRGGSSVVEVHHSNEMLDSFSGAAGINVSAQNVGNNSMVQQASSTNAALVADNSGVGSGSMGSYP